MTGKTLEKKAITIKTIREQIVEHLRSEVLSGTLTGGQPLREMKLAEQYGVSRGPIRDALLQLTKEGLLEAVPNKGVRVKRIPSKLSHSIIAGLRRQLEVDCLKEVFPKITNEDLLAWKTNLGKFKQACEGEDMIKAVKFDMEFHQSVVDKVGDPDISAIWIPLITHMMLPYSRHRNLIEAYEEHRQILECICNEDLSGAVKSLKNNIK